MSENGQRQAAAQLQARYDDASWADRRDVLAAALAEATRPGQELRARVEAKCDEIGKWLDTEIVTDNGFAEQVGHAVLDEIRSTIAAALTDGTPR